MDNLVFRAPPGLVRYMRVFAAVAACITVGLAAIAYFRVTPLIVVLLLPFTAGLVTALWANVTYPRAFTECSPDGIRASGLFGFRIRNCPWTEVDKISVVNGAGSSTSIMVTRHDGSRFRLGVPSRLADRAPPLSPGCVRQSIKGTPGATCAVGGASTTVYLSADPVDGEPNV